MTHQQKLQKFTKQRASLFWDIPKSKLHKLSEEAILERVLQYADVADFQELFKILTVKKAKQIFETIAAKKRPNLSPRTINYFTLYFDKFASWDFKWITKAGFAIIKNL